MIKVTAYHIKPRRTKSEKYTHKEERICPKCGNKAVLTTDHKGNDICSLCFLESLG